jgi:RNA polymerase sigma factor (sigma-70 family)
MRRVDGKTGCNIRGRNAEELLEESEFQELVEGQLQRLSQVERAVLVLYHQEERTYEQIALALGLPIGTVRTHLHRGRKKLREGIGSARVEGRITPGKGTECKANA